MTVLELGPAILFCPADRPDRYKKALDRADAIILDLEDAVAPHAREEARKHLASHPMDPARTIVRINSTGTEDFKRDIHALKQTDYRFVMLAKAESPAFPEELTDYSLIALCETAKGVINAAELAQAPNVVALMWGAEDLVASLGGVSSRWPDGRYRGIALQARSQVLLAAGAAGKASLDSVYLDIADVAGLQSECEDAVASGFAAKASIHPAQVPIIRKYFAPGPQEVEEAHKLLEAARGFKGVFAFNGTMVDEPVLKQARQTIARARHPASSPAGA